MRHISYYINKSRSKLSWELFIYFVVFIVFFTNTLYLAYPDEFVNVIGGKYINLGKIPYKEFFDHHLPLAWYLSSFMLKISFGSFILFRIWWVLLIFLTFTGLGLYLRKANKKLYKYYLSFFFLVPFVMVYFWLHLYLADSLAFIFFLVIFWLLADLSYKTKINSRIIYFLSIVNFLFIFSSLTYIYIAIVFYLWMFYLLFKNKFKFVYYLRFIIFCVVPYIIYFIYLLMTDSLKEFYYANVVYNTELYMSIPNYVKGKYFNPFKFVLTLIFNFYQNYISVLVRVEELDLNFPIGLLVGWGSFLALFILFFKDKILFIIYFLILSLSAPRSNVAKLGETDYQSGVYIALGLASTFLVLWQYKELKFKETFLDFFKKLSVFVLFLFLLYSALFLVKNTYDKFYSRYTQKMPGIYDLAYRADVINDVLDNNDFFWIGPYEPDEAFYVKKAKFPGKYISLMPQFREHDYFAKSFIFQFEANRPSMIIYIHESSVFNTPAEKFGAFFLDWMKDKYLTLNDLKDYNIIKSPTNLNMKTDVYILKSKKDILINRLVKKGYLKHL